MNPQEQKNKITELKKERDLLRRDRDNYLQFTIRLNTILSGNSTLVSKEEIRQLMKEFKI